VVDIATNRALPKTRVTLFSDNGNAPPPVFTDANGNFLFESLAAGHYTLLAEKTAYGRLRYGARTELDPPSEIDIEAGSPVEELLVHLTKGAAIFGRVSDEFGDPVVGGQVSLAIAQTVGDGIRTVPVARPAVLTDDRGQYRIGDLPPGRYFVILAAGNLGSTVPGTPREWERLAPWGKTFYPGGASVSEATPIVLGPGEERGAVDFPVRSRERAQLRLNGTNVSPQPPGLTICPNCPESQLRLWFFSEDDSSLMNGRALGMSGFNGNFSGLTVPINEPGQWTVLARSGADKGAIVNFHLSAGDDLSVDLDFQATSAVSGRVVFDGTGARPDPSTIAISVNGAGIDENIPSRFLLTAPVTPKRDGTFALPNLLGTIRLQATAPPGWILSSAAYAGRNVLDDSLVLRPGEDVSGVQLIFTDRIGAVAGRVALPDGTPAAGCAVALFPDDASPSVGSRRMRLTRTDVHGQFSVRDLPAGAYRAAAASEIDAASWLTSGAIDRLRQISSPVAVTGRSQVPVTLPCTVSQ
jgi:hypothetical protein